MRKYDVLKEKVYKCIVKPLERHKTQNFKVLWDYAD